MNPISRILVAALLAQSTLAAAFFIPSRPRNGPIAHEFVNVLTGNYIVLTDTSEVMDERAGPGWLATGQAFETDDEGVPVCRFYAPAANVHFFTADAAECENLKAPGTGWVFERIAFRARVAPAERGCSGQGVARMFDPGAPRPIHRYVDARTAARLASRGWIREGTLCSSEVSHFAAWRIGASGGNPVRPEAQCPATGPCSALGGLAAMPVVVPPYVPPWYITDNPAFPREALAWTGDLQDLVTSVTSGNQVEIMSHSYVGAGGFHLRGSDRRSGDLASIRAQHVAPLRSGPDGEPLHPWRFGKHAYLQASISVTPRKLEASPGAAAYGHPTIRFHDQASGIRIDVTVQAFGTREAGDFTVADPPGNRVIVSTVFRPNPAFGEVENGTYQRCQSECDWLVEGFEFRLDRIHFDQVLARARAVEPRLSADADDYAVAMFDFKVETFGDARLGVRFRGASLALYID
jgi:hypothetical protein